MLALFLFVGGCWFIQPTLPQDTMVIGEEFLRDKDYAEVADSSVAILLNVVKEQDLPSLSLAVGDEYGVLWAVSIGHADISNDITSKLNTRYRAGSVSKSITGLIAARLVQNGVLDLDSKISNYVSAWPEKRWEPTVRQLASHTGGIRHYNGFGQPGFVEEQFSRKQYKSVSEALGIFLQDSLLYEPGSNFNYSTHGYTLLSAALEGATGDTFLSLLEEHINTSIGISDTGPDDSSSDFPDRAIPYTRIGNRLVHTEGPNPSYKWAGGGLLTTPSDLVHVGVAMANGEIVSDSLLHVLLTPENLTDGRPNPQNYALGWRNWFESELLNSVDTVKVWNHGGASPGGSSYFLVIPDGKISAAVMTNFSLGDAWPIRKTCLQVAGMFRNYKTGVNN